MTFTVAGSRFLITGAAMGMGRLYAERAVAEGAETVILWDINKEALTETTKALRVHADNTQEIVPMLVDIGERGAIEKAAAGVDRRRIGERDVDGARQQRRPGDHQLHRDCRSRRRDLHDRDAARHSPLPRVASPVLNQLKQRFGLFACCCSVNVRIHSPPIWAFAPSDSRPLI